MCINSQDMMKSIGSENNVGDSKIIHFIILQFNK